MNKKQQLHKRFNTEQVKTILRWYIDKALSLKEAQERLEVGKTRFCKLLSRYQKNPNTFTIEYPDRSAHNRLSLDIEDSIRKELEKEKSLIDNPSIPLKRYNYSAVRDEVADKEGKTISAQTVRNRAREWGFTQSKPQKKIHDRIVMTNAVGMLFQHDASQHLWTPYTTNKWSLITTLDDFSRKIIYADFSEKETAWAHIEAAESVILTYGTGLAYYVDNHSFFRFVCYLDSIWMNRVKGTDDVMPQWKRVVSLCGMKVWYAMSPQAKGKIERPYRWLQDRIVRKCAKEGIKNINEAKKVLKEEVDRYNSYQVHSTTKEIPDVRFERAIHEGNSVLKPFALPKLYESTKDIFCLYEVRRTDGYGRISWKGQTIQIPGKILPGSEIILHIIPDPKNPELRACFQNKVILVMKLKPIQH